MPAWLERILWNPFVVTAAIGMCIGWAMLTAVKALRRDAGREKWSNATHRVIAMALAFCGALLASELTTLTHRQAFATAVLTGLLCPMFWGALIALTAERNGWAGRLHWYLRGDRRINPEVPIAGGCREKDPASTWWD